MKRIHGRPYLYFWAYGPRSWGARRTWTYVGPLGSARTRERASALLLDHHLRIRSEVDRRIARLQRLYAERP